MKTVIKVGNVECSLDCDSTTLLDLDRSLSVEVPGAFWARQSNPGWDGYWHPLNVRRQTFPTGLLDRVQKLLPLAQTIDDRPRPHTIELNTKILLGIVLSDHQQESVKAALKKGRGIIGTSVGSGKTESGIALAYHVDGQCVWITHRKDLFHQTAERIKLRTGETPAMIGDGGWDEVTSDKKFVVVMPQTVLKDVKFFSEQVKGANTLIMDEVHRSAASAEFFKLVQHIPAYFRIGLSGTLELGDQVRERRLEAATGSVLIRLRSSDMAKLGLVVPCKVIFHRIQNQPLHGVDYMDARRILIEENPERNAMIIDLALQSAAIGKRCLIICDTIRHAMLISEVLKGEDVRSRLLTGKHASAQRSEAKKDIKSGALEIMISTPIWDEGVDLPELEVVIIAAGGKSAARFIQRCGRALRKSPGKDKALIHDFYDTGSRYTSRHSISRIQACQKEGFEVVGITPEIAAQLLRAKTEAHEQAV